MKVEFFYDCSSPFTYLGFHNLEAMARELSFAVIWRPILVGGVFNAVNQSVYATRAAPVAAKEAYFKKDIQDWARRAGLTIKFPPSVFPVNSVKAMRGCVFLAAEGKDLSFARAAFEAHWRDDEDIALEPVLARLCTGIGVEPERFFAGIAEPRVKERLRANTDELIARGGFGSPTVFINGGEMYFGNDRLIFVRDAVGRRDREAQREP